MFHAQDGREVNVDIILLLNPSIMLEYSQLILLAWLCGWLALYMKG